MLVAPTYNCATNEFKFNTVGGDGSPITFSAIGISGSTTTCTAMVDAGVAQDIRDQRSSVAPFTLSATQNGVTVTYSWNALTACSSPPSVTVTPTPTPGLALIAPTYNCSTGAFTFNTQGSNGSPVEYFAVGITGWTTNPGPITVRPARDVQPFTLKARYVGQPASEITYSWDFLATCPISARVGVESAPALEVMVLGNPVQSETVNIEIRGAANQSLRIGVLSTTGVLMSEIQVKQAALVERHTLRLGSSAGAYLLNVSTNNQTKTVKVIK